MACHDACRGLPQEFREHHQQSHASLPDGMVPSRQPHDHHGSRHGGHSRGDATYTRPHPGINRTYIIQDPHRVPVDLPWINDGSPVSVDSPVMHSYSSSVVFTDDDPCSPCSPSNEFTFYNPGPLAASTMNSRPPGLSTFYDEDTGSYLRNRRLARNRAPDASAHPSDRVFPSPDRPARSHDLQGMPSFPEPGATYPHHSHPGGRRAAHRPHERPHHSHHGDGRHHESERSSRHGEHEMSAAEEEVNELERMNILTREDVHGHFFHDHEEQPLDLSRSQLLSGVDILDWGDSSEMSSGRNHFNIHDYDTSTDPSGVPGASGGVHLSVFDPMELNETMSPRTRDWNAYRRLVYGSLVGDLTFLEAEEDAYLRRMLDFFQVSRMEELESAESLQWDLSPDTTENESDRSP